MTTPNKRRKKNDYQPSPQPVRSLDFFFGRPKASETAENAEPTPNRDRNNHGVNISADPTDDEAPLTDEQLARKLQAQFDAESQPQQQGVVNGVQDVSAYGTADEDPGKVSIEPRPALEDAKPSSDAQDSLETKPNNDAFAALGKKTTLSLQSAMAEEDPISHAVPFDQSPLSFNPPDYLEDLRKQWKPEGGDATYALLTHCFVLVNSTQSRIKIVDTLVNLLRTIIEGDPESLLPAVWLATNSISPPYIDIELGLGGSAISKGLKKVCGLDNAGLKTLYNKYGDAGDVAFEAKKRQSLTLRKPKPLTIKGVFDSLLKTATRKVMAVLK